MHQPWYEELVSAKHRADVHFASMIGFLEFEITFFNLSGNAIEWTPNIFMDSLKDRYWTSRHSILEKVHCTMCTCTCRLVSIMPQYLLQGNNYSVFETGESKIMDSMIFNTEEFRIVDFEFLIFTVCLSGESWIPIIQFWRILDFPESKTDWF